MNGIDLARLAAVLIPLLAVVAVYATGTSTPRYLPARRRPARLESRADLADRIDAEARAATTAHATLLAGGPQALLDAGHLTVTATAPDPGNPGATLRLAHDPHRVISRSYRALLAWNAPTGHGDRTLHAIPVPPDMTDPVAAAAWTYGITRDDYLDLARRT